MAAFDFNGKDTAESGTIALVSGQVVRVRFTALKGSAECRLKINVGGNISYVSIDDDELWVGPALPGDTVSVAYNGQGNPASIATGFVEAVTL